MTIMMMMTVNLMRPGVRALCVKIKHELKIPPPYAQDHPTCPTPMALFMRRDQELMRPRAGRATWDVEKPGGRGGVVRLASVQGWLVDLGWESGMDVGDPSNKQQQS